MSSWQRPQLRPVLWWKRGRALPRRSIAGIPTRKGACTTFSVQFLRKWDEPPRRTSPLRLQPGFRKHSRKNPTAIRMPMRGRRDKLSRREFTKLLAGTGLALSVPGTLAVPTTQGAIQLQNAAPACGLDFVLRNDAHGRKYQVETVLGGLGV